MRTERDEVVERLECYLLAEKRHPHQRLPSERDLCKLLNVSRTALRCAIQQLADEGTLYSKPGSGTYVATAKIRIQLRQNASVRESVEKAGRTYTSKIILFDIVESGKTVGGRLQILLGTQVYCVQRLHLIDGIPCVLDTSYLPCDRFPNLVQHDFEQSSLPRTLLDKYAVIVRKRSEKLSLTYATPEEGKRLDIQEDQPLFFNAAIYHDRDGKPMIYAKRVARPDIVEFASLLT